MLNLQAFELCQRAAKQAAAWRVKAHSIASALLIDAGIETTGSLAAGLMMAQVCLGGAAEVSVVPEDADRFGSDWAVAIQTDSPITACLGGQYAGWPVTAGKFFAMGSGPMRMARGREEVLEELGLREVTDRVAGVLESTELPPIEAIEAISVDCQVPTSAIALMVAPAGSLAGTVQVVARSVETALHKLHALQFDVRHVFSAAGVAPLGPPAKPADVVGGIGRTNDAILYGGRVTLWVDCDQAEVDAVADSVPSSASRDHGRPFADIFKDYQYDFYQVDPHLFSPAVVQIINRRSGLTRRCGRIETDILRTSFGT